MHSMIQTTTMPCWESMPQLLQSSNMARLDASRWAYWLLLRYLKMQICTAVVFPRFGPINLSVKLHLSPFSQGLVNVALDILSRIHTIPTVPIVDCFQKIRQQVKCYLQLAGVMGKNECMQVRLVIFHIFFVFVISIAFLQSYSVETDRPLNTVYVMKQYVYYTHIINWKLSVTPDLKIMLWPDISQFLLKTFSLM